MFEIEHDDRQVPFFAHGRCSEIHNAEFNAKQLHVVTEHKELSRKLEDTPASIAVVLVDKSGERPTTVIPRNSR